MAGQVDRSESICQTIGLIGRIMGEIGEGIRSFKDSFSKEESSDSVSETNLDPK